MHLNNNISGIIGPRGSGKTYLAAQMFGKEKRAICWNPKRDIEFLSRSTMQFDGGASVIAKSWEVLKKPDTSFRIDFHPTDIVQNDARTRMKAVSLDEVSSLCMDAHNVHFYFDEAHRLLGAGYAPPHFLTILQEGRHHQVSLTMIAHRMARIPRDFTQEVDDFYFFTIWEKADLEDVEDTCGELVAHRVANLRRMDLRGEKPKPGEYYHYNMITHEGEIINAATGKVILTDDVSKKNKVLFDETV